MKSRSRGPRAAAFTLIELLMVLAIVGLITAITVPSFVRSMKGNRLRAASRQVVMAGRYTRSMSVLNQRQMAIVFNLEAATFTIHDVPSTFVSEDSVVGAHEPHFGAGLPDVPERPGRKERDEDEDEDEEAKRPLGLGEAVLSRKLDGVRIAHVELAEEEDRHEEGSCQVRYRSNGTCTPFSVLLIDEEGSAVRVSFDALSTAKTEREP